MPLWRVLTCLTNYTRHVATAKVALKMINMTFDCQALHCFMGNSDSQCPQILSTRFLIDCEQLAQIFSVKLYITWWNHQIYINITCDTDWGIRTLDRLKECSNHEGNTEGNTDLCFCVCIASIMDNLKTTRHQLLWEKYCSRHRKLGLNLSKFRPHSLQPSHRKFNTSFAWHEFSGRWKRFCSKIQFQKWKITFLT